MSRKKRTIIIKESLYIDIYLVGYKQEGESIIFIIYVDDTIDYVGVIDSYEIKGVNKTLDILNELKIKIINLLCWTHPDKDHSLGIDKLLELTDKTSKIVIPSGLERIEKQLKSNILDSYNKINAKSKKVNNYSVLPIAQDQKLDRCILYKYNDGDLVDYEFKMIALAPHSSIIQKRHVSSAEKIKVNDYSIAFYIELGPCTFLFGGDIEDNCLEKLDIYDLPESYEYVKIPHHASKTSELIFETIFDEETDNTIACTTTMAKSYLPDEYMIRRYKTNTQEVYCTDNSMSFIKEKVKKSCGKGLIHCRFDILKGGELILKKLEGDAVKIE